MFGALFGPVIGAAAALLGRSVVFTALAGLAVVLGAWALRLEDARAEEPSKDALAAALRNRRFVAGLVLMTLPALLFGILSVLGPLHLSDAGWGAAAIGGVWLFAAALESIQGPIVGRIVDRRGSLFPVRIALATGVVVSVALAFGGRPVVYVPLLVLASLAYGMLFTPGFALLADGADAVGLAQGMAFGLMNAAWATGAVAGPAAAGAIAGATGDIVPFLLAAVLCAAPWWSCVRAHDAKAPRFRPVSCDRSGRVAQRESTRFTREGSLVRSQPRPPEKRPEAGAFSLERVTELASKSVVCKGNAKRRQSNALFTAPPGPRPHSIGVIRGGRGRPDQSAHLTLRGPGSPVALPRHQE